MPPKHKPRIQIQEAPAKKVVKEHISEYILTVNPNTKNLDENYIAEQRERLFSEDENGNGIERWLKFNSGDMDDVISIQVNQGKIELMPTTGKPHWHAHIMVTHTAILQLDYDLMKKEIKNLYGAGTYVNITRHNNYSAAAKNYVNK